MKHRRTTIAIICAALLFLTLTGCEAPKYPDGLAPLPKAGDLAEAVLSAYQDNPVRLQAKHWGNAVRARGRVLSILADGTVKIGPTGTAKPALICMFTQREDVIVLNPRDAVVITGQLDSVKGLHVLLKECTLDDHEPK